MVRMELLSMLRALLERFETLEVKSSVQWQNRKGHRWPDEFQVSAKLS